MQDHQPPQHPHRDLRGVYGNKTSSFRASLHLTFRKMSTPLTGNSPISAFPCVVPKLLVSAVCFSPRWPSATSPILAEKRDNPVLYLGLKALYVYWYSMSGQFSGFSKYTTEFLAAALGRGPEACCCCRCWDASKGSMLNPGK